MRDQSLKQGIPRVSLFLVDIRNVRSLSVTNSAYRFMSLVTFGYISLNFFSGFKRLSHLHGFVYGCTAGSFAITVITNFLFRRARKDFILKIEYDLEEESFVVTSPSTSLIDFGSPQEETIDIRDFKMLPKEK